MKELQLRKTTVADLPRLQEIYEIARRFMVSTGNPNQWTDSYPVDELLLDDIRQGDSFVWLCDGQIVGTFVLRSGADPTYAKIYDGAWLNDEPYATIHRIASAGEVKGLFAKTIEYALTQFDHLRIDTHRDNRVMQHVIGKAGFTYCGIIYCWEDAERLAYQLDKQ